MTGQTGNSQEAITVSPGLSIEVELVDEAGESECLSFIIVPDRLADFQAGLLGESTPLARAILGQVIGSLVSYQAGETLQVRILSVAQVARPPDSEAATRRKEAARKAQDEAERANARTFAASFSGKWGDYDPDGMDHWEEKGAES